MREWPQVPEPRLALGRADRFFPSIWYPARQTLVVCGCPVAGLRQDLQEEWLTNLQIRAREWEVSMEHHKRAIQLGFASATFLVVAHTFNTSAL